MNENQSSFIKTLFGNQTTPGIFDHLSSIPFEYHKDGVSITGGARDTVRQKQLMAMLQGMGGQGGMPGQQPGDMPSGSGNMDPTQVPRNGSLNTETAGFRLGPATQTALPFMRGWRA